MDPRTEAGVPEGAKPMILQAGPRHCRLAVAPKNLFSADRDKLCAAASVLTGRRYHCPADALLDVLRLLGYRLRKGGLPDKVFAQVCPGLREVTLCSALRWKLRHPEAVEAVTVFSLAHELAHVRLHVPAILAGSVTRFQEEEANRYAGVFLMPSALLQSHPSWSRFGPDLDSAELWQITKALADSCRVSGQAMAIRLSHLGLLRHCPKTRELRWAYAA